MHRPLLIASLAGSVLGFALPELEVDDAPLDSTVHSTIEVTNVITKSVPYDDDDGIPATTLLAPHDDDAGTPATTLTATSTTVTTATTTATQTAYVTATLPAADDGDEGSPEGSSTPEEPSQAPSTAPAPASDDQTSTSTLDASGWPTLLPAVPGNQPSEGLDSLTPTNSSKLTFTLDGNSDLSTKHLVAEMTANHTTPAVVLEHSAQIVDVSCAPQGLKVDLSTEEAVDFARSAWDENFVAITSSADCGGTPASGQHSYWNVTAVTYPDATLTALLDAVEIDVADFFDHVDLVWGANVPQSTTPGAPSPSQTDTGTSLTDDDDDDDDDSDDEGGALDFDEDFADALHDFAPGLSTYAEEDYEDEDSPANGTAGDPDYDIWNSGIIDTEGAQPSDEPIEKRQDYPLPAPARKPYDPPEPKPAQKAKNAQDYPIPAPAKKPYGPPEEQKKQKSQNPDDYPLPEPANKPYGPPRRPKEQVAQDAVVAKEGAKVTEEAYSIAQENLQKAREAAEEARANYYHRRFDSRRNPADWGMAWKLRTAKAKLRTANKAAKLASDIARSEAVAKRAARRKAARLLSIEEAQDGKGGGSKNKVGKANPMAVAERVAQSTISNLQDDAQVRRDAQKTARGLRGYIRSAYKKLVKVVRQASETLSNIKPDFSIQVDYSLVSMVRVQQGLGLAPFPKVDDDSPWGSQVLLYENKTEYEKGNSSTLFKFYCVDCGFTATIYVEGHVSFSVSQMQMTKGSITVEGSDLAAKLMIGLDAFAQATPWSRQRNVAEVAIPPGFSIPKVITLGPAVRWDIRASLKLEAEGNVLAGVEGTFSNFTSTVDLVDRSAPVSFEGFVPTWTTRFEAFGSIRAGVRLGSPFSIGVTLHLPLIQKDVGLVITSEPYLQAVASYGDTKNCTRGIDYKVNAGNDIYVDVLKYKTIDIRQDEAPPIVSGCVPIPSSIAKYMPKGLVEQFTDPQDKKPSRPQLNSSSVYATARKAVKDAKAAGDFYFDTVTAGGGEWYLFAGATGGVELVAAPEGTNANKPAYAQQAFAHMHDVVVADAQDRLLHYDRDAVDKWGVSPLSFVDEKDIGSGDRAIALLPILVAGGETRDEDDWVFEPEDTEGNSFGTISCAVTMNDPSSSSSPEEEMTVNKVFIAQNVDKAIETLERGDAASKQLANGDVEACEGIAIDGVETNHGYGI
ncbi:uncharacterized protein LTHEOB_10520 [Lasiodiplodia theobromae]|uniref:uncharacterized protein n=1 Tax=Lasiodiplodia theobromae TaxID=45133 RepID=UPI0015C3ACA5|nr:uncharacterized protein LTHEOB_10520 [Lasiodiplodia theobromae]KAF4539128.1 hypothetical protein LTHEOB_10520 [Lasiodiplodia theobromae]